MFIDPDSRKGLDVGLVVVVFAGELLEVKITTLGIGLLPETELIADEPVLLVNVHLESDCTTFTLSFFTVNDLVELFEAEQDGPETEIIGVALAELIVAFKASFSTGTDSEDLLKDIILDVLVELIADTCESGWGASVLTGTNFIELLVHVEIDGLEVEIFGAALEVCFGDAS